jgi:hypothetical protein
MESDDIVHEAGIEETDAAAQQARRAPTEPAPKGTPSGGPFRGQGAPPPASRRGLTRRALALSAVFVGVCGLLAADIRYIVKKSTQHNMEAARSAASVPHADHAQAPSARPAPSVVASSAVTAPPIPDHANQDFEDEAPFRPAKHFATVQQVYVGACSTSAVDGLSRQIIDQVRCSHPNVFVPLPSRPNLVVGAHVYPYLESSARDHLLKVLDGNRDRKMTVHSALRTVAQQYLVWMWASNKRCGIPLATAPGTSNHELGRALDIADPAQWRPLLEAQDFHWLGASDVVHFDFKTHRATGLAPDVLAFQRLWNHSHADDRIAETGRYDQNTEDRLKKSPPGGFPLGTTCAARNRKRPASR